MHDFNFNFESHNEPDADVFDRPIDINKLGNKPNLNENIEISDNAVKDESNKMQIDSEYDSSLLGHKRPREDQ